MRAIFIALAITVVYVGAARAERRVPVRMTWGEDAHRAEPYHIKLIPATPGLQVTAVRGASLESGEGSKDGAWQTRAGAGDVDGIDFVLTAPDEKDATLQNMEVIWADLISNSDADTARRLGQDAAIHPQSPRLTVQRDSDGTRGFTVTLDQLLTAKAIWIPSLHVYLATGDDPVSFAEHKRQLEPWAGKRILDQVAREPEATYSEYTSRWEDMGSPTYVNPRPRGPGHIVGLTWDSAIPKFGIDRGAGVWNDYGNSDHFQFWFNFGDIAQGIIHTWKGQHLQDGLPVITTDFEKDGVRYEVEQFAYPLNGPPKERRGDIDMLLMQQVRVINLEGHARRIPVTFSHLRELPSYIDAKIYADRHGDTVLFRDRAYNRVLFAVSGFSGAVDWNGVRDDEGKRQMKRVDGTVFLDLPANGSSQFVVKLASPMVGAEDAAKLQAIDYQQARRQTLDFWSNYVARGAHFEVPEKAVNDLFRASLWHALRLPRRHGGSGQDVKIDLPYSNFAYSQTGTPWPINQSVYVDYMLYDLRGYHSISDEELVAQFRNNQEENGHINGVSNWGAYTPGMLYAVAQNYLLSHDRAALDRLMPYSLKALDYCMREIAEANLQTGHNHGLVTAPLNDLTSTGVWAFNQAYMYAGLDLFGRVLEEIGNPRGAECRRAASQLKEAATRDFRTASMHSPLVELRDHTWEPYVPSEANTYRRMFEEWYPADVDTGAVHMIRLKAIAANSQLADWLLNDHEDNLYLKGWGIANEPVYNQQATAYLLRDDPKAVIRAFYSYMASAFSHSVFEPVEHRWTHGQYFGPPSTDGAWFELYRNMLIHERDDDALVLGMATPRAWLAEGQKIVVQRAPTYYGNLSMTIESHASTGRIIASVTMPDRGRPRELLVRLRHPHNKTIRSVSVNGKNWTDFDTRKEWVRIVNPTDARYSIVASY
jgi:hypothetical protein